MLDHLLGAADVALRTVLAQPRTSRPCPMPAGHDDEGAALSQAEKKLSGALMRVNHTGEVCAQALYNAQALGARTFSKNAELAVHFEHAGREEADHLAWTKKRLDELGAKPSLLMPAWYLGSFGLGLLASRMGEKVSLGFVVETERQVEAHLASHLDKLPQPDHASRAVVAQMMADEARHACEAQQAGAVELPSPVKAAMKIMARVMTSVAHRI